MGAYAATKFAQVGLGSLGTLAIALPPEELSKSSGPLLAVVGASGVGIPDWVFSLIALIGVFGVLANRRLETIKASTTRIVADSLPGCAGKAGRNRCLPSIRSRSEGLIGKAMISTSASPGPGGAGSATSSMRQTFAGSPNAP